MVGLSDIPCVGILVNRISEAIVDIAFRGSRYLFCTKNLVKDLNSQIKKVEILENEFARKVDEATNDGKIIEGRVVEWQENAENMKTQVAEISVQETSCICFSVQFPNPVARFRLGRRAAHLAKTVTEQTVSGNEFLGKEIAHHLPVENVPNSDTLYQSFGSRQEAYAKLWNSIVNEDGSPILGIYGMPGVGKTRTMEQLWKEAMEKGIFKKVTRANVGDGDIDVKYLQDQLAGYLDCHLWSEDNKEARALQLKTSLENAGKTLVILDDVWDVIPLNKIGIPFADGTSKGCKILLTSRRKDLCLSNNCEDPVEIKTLTVTEAWEMFKRMVGTSKIESFQDILLAEEVCKKCGALPLLIQAVGKALKYGTENSWKDALHQLENRTFEEIEGIDPQVYACLQLSFMKLSEGARRRLLLCSELFPEDADIEIELLYDIATGSGLLERGRNIHGLVDILKSSSLLLHGKDDYTVKVHDIIRDVARSIAATDSKYAFSYIRCKSRWPHNADYPTRRLLHVDLDGDNVLFPDDLVCQDLHTLWLQCNNHTQNRLSSFFKEFTNLRVVVLQGMRGSEQQFSVHTLVNLRMLTLEDCDIDQIFLDSISRTLETLCIWECSLPVPLEIPELKDLIKLDLVSRYERHVVTGISKLSSLQELNVPRGFETNDYADISAELSTLNCLRKLWLDFGRFSSCPSSIVDNLVEFRINVGLPTYFLFDNSKSSVRGITLRQITIENGWRRLLERAHSVTLYETRGLEINSFSDSCNTRTEAFARLRELEIIDCYEMEHIARWDGRNNQQLKCFTNLQNLFLNGCRGLEYVFSSRVANCLCQLQKLQVRYCEKIEEIVRVDDGQEIISFPKLIELRLENLPRLTSLYTDNNKVEFPQLKILEALSCKKLEAILHLTMFPEFQNLEKLDIGDCQSLKTVFHHSSPATNPNMVFPALKFLTLEGLPNLESFFSYDNEFLEINDSKPYVLFTCSVFTSFKQLQNIRVSGCDLLTEIVEDGDETNGINHMAPISLLQLKSVILEDLPNLQKCEIFSCDMPALSVITIVGCAIPSLFRYSTFKTRHINLKSLSVENCPSLEQILVDDTDDETPGPSEKMISFPLLETIKLEHLQGLKSFSRSSTSTFIMPALKYIMVNDCPCMDKFTFLQITTPLLEDDLNDYVTREVYGKYCTVSENSSEEYGDGYSSYGNYSEAD